MTNTIQELQLIKHTAWMNANRPHRGATEEEANRITPYVIGAVVYTAVLNGVMYDLIDTLKDERQYNDRAKKVLRMLHHSATMRTDRFTACSTMPLTALAGSTTSDTT